MCRKFVSVCYHNYSHVYCLWHDGLVCVCCTTWPEVLFFKVARRTWHWLPRCPLLQEKWSCGFRWFPFVPDLYALVWISPTALLLKLWWCLLLISLSLNCFVCTRINCFVVFVTMEMVGFLFWVIYDIWINWLGTWDWF